MLPKTAAPTPPNLGSFSVFVCDVTSPQGFAVADKLLDQNHVVHVLVDDPNDEWVMSLRRHRHNHNLCLKERKHAIHGKYETWTLRNHMKGCKFLFYACSLENDTGHLDESGLTTVLDAAKEAGVENIIYSSAPSLDGRGFELLERETLIPKMAETMGHKQGLEALEQKVRDSCCAGEGDVSRNYAILRPAFFVEDLATPVGKQFWTHDNHGQWALRLPTDKKLSFLSIDDLAGVVVSMVEQFHFSQGKTLPIATTQTFPHYLAGSLRSILTPLGMGKDTERDFYGVGSTEAVCDAFSRRLENTENDSAASFFPQNGLGVVQCGQSGDSFAGLLLRFLQKETRRDAVMGALYKSQYVRGE